MVHSSSLKSVHEIKSMRSFILLVQDKEDGEDVAQCQCCFSPCRVNL